MEIPDLKAHLNTLRYHYLREQIDEEEKIRQYIPTYLHKEIILTKPLPETKFNRLMKHLVH